MATPVTTTEVLLKEVADSLAEILTILRARPVVAPVAGEIREPAATSPAKPRARKTTTKTNRVVGTDG